MFSFVITSRVNNFVYYKNDITQKYFFIIKKSFWDEKEAKALLEELRFYNASIEKPYIKYLHNIYFLRELPFYDNSSIVKISKGFEGYARTYSIEIIDSKDPSVQLTPNKPSIEDLFDDLLDEIKGFKYQ